MPNHKTIPPIEEHNKIPEKFHDLLNDIQFVGNPDYMDAPKFLGINQDYNASYYIGACWLIKNELAVSVIPKIKNIDFITMFISALEVNTAKESDYFSQCYGIMFNEPQIETTEQLNQLTPLLILHYISLLDKLVKRGLKKDYIIKEDNLKSKVKGRIMFSRHLRKNTFQQRYDRTYCQFQEHTENIPENRLLKKALIFAESAINAYPSIKTKIRQSKELSNCFSRLKSVFYNVSDEIEIRQVQKITGNKIFREYKEAIKVAKMILQRFDYSLSNATQEQHRTPPFWIDMARLYEMYVYSKLNSAYPNQILFQVAGHCQTAVDYIKKDEKIIMDAKYKPHYEDSNRGIIDDIREISGYARDWKILNKLGIKNSTDEQEIKCIIIYPQREIFHPEDESDTTDYCNEVKAFDEKQELIQQCSKTNWFRNFYKISVPLPQIQT
jgi:5-methylcytosine-specific restriction enzyme subunit McrC